MWRLLVTEILYVLRRALAWRSLRVAGLAVLLAGLAWAMFSEATPGPVLSVAGRSAVAIGLAAVAVAATLGRRRWPKSD